MRRATGLLSALLAVAAACGGGGGGTGPTNNQTLASISTTPSSISNLQAGSTLSIAVHGTDTDGNAINNLSGIVFSSQNNAIADVISGTTVLGIAAGSTQITVTVSFNGVTKVANVPVTVTGTLPNTNEVVGGTSTLSWSPSVVAVARTGKVNFTFGTVAHSVLFSPAAGAPGNIPVTSSTTVPVTFNTAGNFAFECGIHPGMTGVVIVR